MVAYREITLVKCRNCKLTSNIEDWNKRRYCPFCNHRVNNITTVGKIEVQRAMDDLKKNRYKIGVK